jgi:hypothetical protein
MKKIKRKKYVCLRVDGETFVTWAESPEEAREDCMNTTSWVPFKVIRLPGAVQTDWVQEELETAVEPVPVA